MVGGQTKAGARTNVVRTMGTGTLADNIITVFGAVVAKAMCEVNLPLGDDNACLRG